MLDADSMLPDPGCTDAWHDAGEKRHAAGAATCGMAWLLWVGAAIVLFSCSGCAFWKTLPSKTAQVNITCRSDNATRDIRRMASSITGLDARARVQVIIHGKKYPSVRCALKWSHSSCGERIRITGTGPLGIPVFDALLSDNQFFLYIPSHDAVYTTRLQDDSTAGNDVRTVMAHVRTVLNPWSVLEEPGYMEASCSAPFINFRHLPQDVICYARPHKGKGSLAVFRKTTLSPVMQDTDICTIKFSGLLEDTDSNTLCGAYPAHITVRFKPFRLFMDIKIREAALNMVPHDQQAFNSAGFMSMQPYPLHKLLN